MKGKADDICTGEGKYCSIASLSPIKGVSLNSPIAAYSKLPKVEQGN
jgi:hypothetical protein